MRINRIRLKNYRQFRKMEFLLRESDMSDIHILIGHNGTGKTNLLNAISWCLYGDEPHLTDESRSLPILNTAAQQELAEGEEGRVEVEVQFQVGPDDRYTFTRQCEFRLHGSSVRRQASSFRAAHTDASGNTRYAEGDEAVAQVQRLVPKGIREYFFFDGERLDSYFRDEAGQKISHAVFEIAQIDLLQTVERKLAELVRDLQRKVAASIPEIEAVRQKRDEAEKKRDDLNSRLATCLTQIKTAKKRVEEYSEKLLHMPDVAKLEEERRQLEEHIADHRQLLRDKENERRDLLFRYGILLNVQPALASAVALIDTKREEGKIPPAVDPRLLEQTLARTECAICGRSLDSPAAEHVRRLLSKIEVSTEVADELRRVEGPLRMLLDKVPGFEPARQRIIRDARTYREYLERSEGRVEEIQRAMSGFDNEKVREWGESRKKFAEEAEKQIERKGVLHNEHEAAAKDAVKLNEQLDRELRSEDRAKELEGQIRLCSQAHSTAITAKDRIADVVRREMESRTSEIFDDLVWKRATYQRVEIDDSYCIALIHTTGQHALGSASAAERELLALSFILALHEVSGFEAPIVIDTPVARVAGENRANFSRVLATVGSGGKQVLLLFTPDEYTPSVSEALDPKAASRHEFCMQSGERETQLEDLGIA